MQLCCCCWWHLLVLCLPIRITPATRWSTGSRILGSGSITCWRWSAWGCWRLGSVAVASGSYPWLSCRRCCSAGSFRLGILRSPAPPGGGELGVMLSVAVFGLLLARKQTTALTGCLTLVAGFALFHGYAHAAEAASVSQGAYLVGMITGTAALHAVGLVSGLAIQRLASEQHVRLSGKAIATLGVVLLLGQLV